MKVFSINPAFSEVTEIRYRGSFLNSTTIASGLGIAFGLLLGSTLRWRFACCIPIGMNLIVITTLASCYDSPLYLSTKGKNEVISLQWFREKASGSKEENEENDKKIETELQEIKADASQSEKNYMATLKKLFSSSNLRPFLILLVLFTLYPLTGMYSVMFFAIELFKRIGINSPVTVAVISALLRCLATSFRKVRQPVKLILDVSFFSSILLLKFGRRRIMIVATALCALTNGAVGGLCILKNFLQAENEEDSAEIISWLLAVLVMLFMFLVGISMTGFPWILMGKIIWMKYPYFVYIKS